MAYWGYIGFIKKFLSDRCMPVPTVLEIGMDMGQSLVPLFSYMLNNFERFSLMGCDIVLRVEMEAILGLMGAEAKDAQDLNIYKGSSLKLLPQLLKSKKEQNHAGIDVIMIDGDHNYYTVSKELSYCKDLLAPGGFLIVDDYNGRYAYKDLYYADRETHSTAAEATKREDTEREKKGVRTAVDEFLQENPEWTIKMFNPDLEPALLYRKEEFLWAENW